MSQIQFRNFINGRLVPATGATAEIEDPTTGQVYGTAPVSDRAVVDSAMSAATAAFPAWRATTPAERQRSLLRIADAFEARAEEIAQVECRDTGKPLELTLTEEIAPVVDQVRFFAGAARTLGGLASGEYVRGHTSSIRREPLGVCAQITPWNYPLMMAAWKWAPALAAGNTVVLKPAETTPASTLLTAEILGAVLPPGVFNVICGDRETGRLMVEHPAPAMVSLTGSVRAGIEVMRSAAADVKNVHLELGGKAPALVFADSDLEVAAEVIAGASFFNAGQDCTAVTRVLVEDTVYDGFVDRLSQRAAGTVTGPRPDAEFGPLNSSAHLARVSGFIERLPEHARLTAGGRPLAGPGYYFPATVVADLHQDDEIVQQEVFGPVVTVQRFSSEAEAVALANGVAYGLASSIWTTDHALAVRVAAALDFGVVWINSHMVILAEMPHGGYKHSGSGRDLSLYGLEDYTRIKHVMSSTG